MIEYGIGRKSIKWGVDIAKNELPLGASNPKLKKKFGFKDIKDQSGQSHALGCLDFAQMVLALATEVESYADEVGGQNKFDLLVGEIEMLYLESTNTLKNDFKLNLKKPCIDEIMTMRKKWTVDLVDK